MSACFSFVQKVDGLALRVLEIFVAALYERELRPRVLLELDLRLKQLRFLLRMARVRQVVPAAGFEIAMRGIDELGHIELAWRVAIGQRAPDGRA